MQRWKRKKGKGDGAQDQAHPGTLYRKVRLIQCERAVEVQTCHGSLVAEKGVFDFKNEHAKVLLSLECKMEAP